MISRILAFLLDLFGRLRGQDKTALAHAEAQRDRAVIDAAVAKEDDPASVLQKQFNRSGPHISIFILAGLGLASCAPPAPVVVDTFCDQARIITVTAEDHLTKDTAAQILAHDRMVAATCPAAAR